VLNPAEKRRVIDRNAALAHHLFEIAIADPVFAIPADTDQNDVGREAAAFEIGHDGYLGEAPMISLPAAKECNRANATSLSVGFWEDSALTPTRGQKTPIVLVSEGSIRAMQETG
jgi:hypothetical protein